MKGEASNVKRQASNVKRQASNVKRLRLVRGEPNPAGEQGVQLFLLAGDATAGPVREVVPDEGISLPEPPDGLAEHPFRLRILHFNDLHGRISRITGYGVQPVLSRIVWRARELRRRYRDDPHSAVILLAAGDDFASGAFDESLDDGGYHLYSKAGVDVGVLGNHDFDRGAQRLAQAIRRGAHFPLLSANLVGGRWLDGLYYPAALLVVRGVRIGVVGLTTRAEIKYRAGSEFRLADPVETARNLLPAVRPLCDVLILLSHLGHTLSSQAAVVRDAGDIELAGSLPPGSVHLIVGGHTHRAMNQYGLSVDNVINGIPIVQAGAQGRFLGEVALTLRGRCVAVTSVQLTCTSDLPVDESFEREEVQPVVARWRSFLARPLGRVADHPDLSTDAVRNEFAAGESALANFISDGLVARCRAAGHAVDFSMIDRASVSYGLPVGEQLTFGDWFRLMPYTDIVRVCEMTGRQLAALLADNARRIDRPDEPHVERGFLHLSRQVRYTIALGESRSAARVVEAACGGRPLAEQLERTFRVACIGFMREQAAAWEARHPNLPLLDVRTLPGRNTALILRDEMIAYIRAHGGVTGEGGARRDGRVKVKHQT